MSEHAKIERRAERDNDTMRKQVKIKRSTKKPNIEKYSKTLRISIFHYLSVTQAKQLQWKMHKNALMKLKQYNLS